MEAEAEAGAEVHKREERRGEGRHILFGVERAVGREERGGQVAELAAGHLLRVPPVVLPASTAVSSSRQVMQSSLRHTCAPGEADENENANEHEEAHMGIRRYQYMYSYSY